MLNPKVRNNNNNIKDKYKGAT